MHRDLLAEGGHFRLIARGLDGNQHADLAEIGTGCVVDIGRHDARRDRQSG